MNNILQKRDYYFPRQEMARNLLKNIQTNDPQNMMLFKERRSGKTSFLLRDLIPESLNYFEQYKTIVVYFTFMSSNEKDFAKIFSIHFFRQIEKFSIKQKLKNYLDFLKDFSLSIGLKYNKDEVLLTFENEINKKDDFSIDFDQLFYLFKKRFPDYKLLLCLDEFQELSEYDNKKEISLKLRSAIDFNSSFVKTIFTGSSYNKLMSFFNDYNQPFYNFGFHIYLENFDPNVFVKHITSVYFHNTNRFDLDEKDVLENFIKTEFSPYYVVNALLNKQNNPKLHFKEELNRLLLLDRNLIDKDLIQKNFWANLKNIDKIIIYRIVYYNGKLLSNESKSFIQGVLSVYGEDFTFEQIKNKINYSLNKLIKSEKFKKENNEYKLIDLKFKEWLLNQPSDIGTLLSI